MKTSHLLIALSALTLCSCEKRPEACFTVETDNISFIGMGVADHRTFHNCSTEAGEFEWDFGDNTSGSTLDSPDHAYDAVGTYTVTLTAYSPNGRKDDVMTDTVMVRGRAVFFSLTAQYPVTVTVGSETRTGSPTIVYGDCHSAVTFDDLPAGTYSYAAAEQSPGTATWSGTFTISGDGCTQVNL